MFDCPIPPTTADLVDQIRVAHGPGILESVNGATSVLASADQTLPWGTYRYVLSVMSGKTCHAFVQPKNTQGLLGDFFVQ